MARKKKSPVERLYPPRPPVSDLEERKRIIEQIPPGPASWGFDTIESSGTTYTVVTLYVGEYSLSDVYNESGELIGQIGSSGEIIPIGVL